MFNIQQIISMNKPLVYKNNCAIEITPLAFVEKFAINDVLVKIELKENCEAFVIDAVVGSISPINTNERPDAGNLYKLTLSFRVAYKYPEYTALITRLQEYGSLIATFRSQGGQIIVFGTDQYPLQLTYTNPANFDGYDITLSGTQDIAPLFIQP